MRRSTLLKQRQTGLGGSDAPVILGLDPYRTILDLYFEKTGELPPKADNKDMKRGRVLEPVIADLFAEETGAKLVKARTVIRHPAKDYLLVHLDRKIMSMPGQTGYGVLEIKAPRANQYSKWRDSMPDAVFAQVQHSIGVAGLDYGVGCAWIGATDLVWYKVDRDDAFIRYLFEEEERFWTEHVLKGVPPVGRASLSTLAELYPASRKGEVALPAELKNWLEVYVNSRKVRLAMEKAELEAEEWIKSQMGDAEQGLFSDGEVIFGVQWKSSTPYRAWDLKAMEADDELVQRYKTKIATRRTFTVKKKVIGMIAAPEGGEE